MRSLPKLWAFLRTGYCNQFTTLLFMWKQEATTVFLDVTEGYAFSL